jgi:hypothetical protein
MGDKFIALLDFAVRNLGDLKSCSFYDSGATVDVQAKDGKTITVYISVKEENTNA